MPPAPASSCAAASTNRRVAHAIADISGMAWLDCRALDLPAGLAAFFLERAGVLATDGADCGDAGRGFLRLNIATPRPILAEMVRRMGAALVG